MRAMALRASLLYLVDFVSRDEIRPQRMFGGRPPGGASVYHLQGRDLDLRTVEIRLWERDFSTKVTEGGRGMLRSAHG